MCRRRLRAHLLRACAAAGVRFRAGELVRLEPNAAGEAAALALADGGIVRARCGELRWSRQARCPYPPLKYYTCNRAEGVLVLRCAGAKLLTAFPEGRMSVESAPVCLMCTDMKACRQASAQRSMMTRSVGSSLRDYLS